MGKIHENRLVIAPPFTYCQVDLMGPYTSFCRHNHRSTVKVWGSCSRTQPPGRYSSTPWRNATPKLFPDEGSQLLKVCKEMEISWVDVFKDLNLRYQLFDTIYCGVKMDIMGYKTCFAWISTSSTTSPSVSAVNIET
jgi:hypothetical protein